MLQKNVNKDTFGTGIKILIFSQMSKRAKAQLNWNRFFISNYMHIKHTVMLFSSVRGEQTKRNCRQLDLLTTKPVPNIYRTFNITLVGTISVWYEYLVIKLMAAKGHSGKTNSLICYLDVFLYLFFSYSQYIKLWQKSNISYL